MPLCNGDPASAAGAAGGLGAFKGTECSGECSHGIAQEGAAKDSDCDLYVGVEAEERVLLGAGEMVGVVEVGTEEGEVDRRLSPLKGGPDESDKVVEGRSTNRREGVGTRLGVADGGQDERHEQPRVGRALGDVGGAASKGGGSSGAVGCDDGKRRKGACCPRWRRR